MYDKCFLPIKIALPPKEDCILKHFLDATFVLNMNVWLETPLTQV